MTTQTASIYWIHLPEPTNPLTEGYIGVSKDVNFRINSHLTEILNKAYKLDEDISLKDDLNKLIKTYFSSQEYKSLIDKIKNILPSIKF